MTSELVHHGQSFDDQPLGFGGMIATTKARTDEIRFTGQVNYGGIISPFNAWLINRGTVTLPLRMKQHNASAQAIAEHLERIDAIRFVSYPGLEDTDDLIRDIDHALTEAGLME